jgi:hypothetical protein
MYIYTYLCVVAFEGEVFGLGEEFLSFLGRGNGKGGTHFCACVCVCFLLVLLVGWLLWLCEGGGGWCE